MARQGPTTSFRQMRKEEEKDILGRSMKMKKARKAAIKRNREMRRKFMKGN